ncbi:juvenile hormone epoxide hydrolase 1 isoform X1 [Hyalella azteca]|uniref:Epoxide hydrolase n=1 Tax=Hyalella azteca TaxID=294128 RepID=A0A8B7NNF2_HYAAZ|nr:juvenile hormone epoxide hydrolase 1 isoform X1 [Hyalella azteca]
MGILGRISVIFIAVLAWYIAVRLNSTPPLPYIDPDPWWGLGEPKKSDSKIRPFKIDIPAKDVQDLQARLAQAPRLAPSLEGVNFTYGMDSTTMAVILKYWRDSYDWKKRETKLNAYPHFKTRIEGLDIHFMRASPPAGSGKTVRPLLLLHGWPGSFVEFMGILPLLTTPRADSEVVFDVICPSLPGYGFSEAAAKPGMNTLAMAQIMTKLMKRIGFEKFYVQGGDWGSGIAHDIATAFPDTLYGIHVNMVMAMTLGAQAKLMLGAFLPSGTVMDPKLEEKWYPLLTFYGITLREMGYAHLHATKPDTVGVALNSSPQGLAAYILEKFSTWTDMKYLNQKNGGLLDPDFPISLDAMLDNICVYWFTGSITSSMRLYSEFFGASSPAITMFNIPTTVPAGLAGFGNDLAVIPENLAAHKFHNIITYTNPEIGGHFAAMEVPKILADDIFIYVNIVERQMKEEQLQKTKKS